jgi:Tfp pilus assembly protein PilF
MTIPPLHGGGLGIPPLRVPVLTAPVSTGIPPLVGDDDPALPLGAPPTPSGTTPRDDAPIALSGRLEAGDVLPETTSLALALESATRSLQTGRADQVLRELDAVWSQQLASDSPWYLRTAALQLLGRTGDAEQVLRDAIARLPRSAAMLYLLGVHTAHRGQFDAATLANDHALTLHPAEPLLLLQRAALASRQGMTDDAATLLAQVLDMEPGLPAAQWLATLTRLGDDAAQASAVRERVHARLTPVASAIIAESLLPATPDTPSPVAPNMLPPSVLELAVRYGLSLLESPTHSARTATQSMRNTGSMPGIGEAIAGSAAQVSRPSELPVWESLVLGTCLAVLAFVPPLRLPALMLSGAMVMILVSRRLR